MRLIISCGFNRFGQLSGTDTQWEYRDKDEHLMLPPCVMSKVTDIITATWMHTLVIVSIVDEAGNQQQMLQLYGDNAAESILSSDILENTTLPVKYGKLLSTGQYLQLDGADNLIMTHYLPSELKDYRVQLGQYQSVAVSDEGQIAMIKGAAIL
ncbi:hypothetical protein BDF19DRAFT_416371 [Syncephalis fuscata]|nr:hypothetical protein BDF19DRAFT_416371 [Syncephalis fuscata]